VNAAHIPAGYRFERLHRDPPRKAFQSGHEQVDAWLATKALQNQDKHLSTTKILLNQNNAIAGYFTLATGQVDFGDLPADIAKRLPKRMLPVVVVAWLGVSSGHQGQGLGRLLLAQALRDCWEAGKSFAFVAVILDCIDDNAKTFYQKYDFQELPGQPYRLFLSAQRLEALMTAT
jgi:GNAT superfamily N-acetyltransferase